MQLLLVAVLLVAGMLALGTALDLGLLRARLAHPAGLLLVVVVNALAFPAVALAALQLVPMDDAVALGLFLSAAAPGGGTGALLALHARGDVPSAVVLQVVLAAASLATTPAWVSVAAGGSVDVAPLVVGLLVFQLLPLLAGAALRRRRPGPAAVVHRWSRRTADVTLAVLVAGLLVLEGDGLGRVGAPALLLAAALVALSLAAVALPVGDSAVRRSAAMTTCVRNLSLALLAATAADDPSLTSLSVLAYGLVMYLVGAAAVLLLRRGGAPPHTRPP